MFDSNGDGQISKEEMEHVFAGGYSQISKDFQTVWNQICKEADTNNDGQLSYEEFEIAMMKVFQQKATFVKRKS